jgi:hypothetical protein
MNFWHNGWVLLPANIGARLVAADWVYSAARTVGS